MDQANVLQVSGLAACLPASLLPAAAYRSRPLLIRRVDAIPVALPLIRPMRMAGATIRSADNLLVRIEAQDGTVGWGEAASAPTMTGDTGAAMTAAVRDHLAPVLLGRDARHRAVLIRDCAAALYGNTGARSAVEIALHDLVGHALQVSFADLFGGALRHSVRPMCLLGNDTLEDDVAEAVAYAARGFSFFKLKVGVKSLEADIATVLALRRRLGPDIRLCVNANGAFTLPAAQIFLGGVVTAQLEFLEQPVAAANLAGMARLARGATPICADEGIHGVADIVRHAGHGVMGASLNLVKLGGPMAMLQAMMACEQHDVSINVSAMAETALGAAATTQLACVAGNADWGVSLTNEYLAEDIVVTPFIARHGQVELPAGPGLGVEVDEDAVARMRVAA